MVNAKTQRRNKIKKSTGEIIFDTLNIVFMLLMILITVYPIWDVFVSSISKVKGSFGLTLWPKNPSFEAYKLMFSYQELWDAYLLTAVRSLSVVVLTLLVTSMAAYTLSKQWLPAMGIITRLILFTMLFGGGLIPYYLLLKDLGLLNNPLLLFIPGAGAYNMLIMRNFYHSIPTSLEESAALDGASWFTTWSRIVLPLCKPVLATIALWVLLGVWNDWSTTELYMPNTSYRTVQQVLRRFVVQNSASSMDVVIKLTGGDKVNRFQGRMLQSTTILATSLPILIVYPFLQKYFTKGIMLGSVKG